MTEVETVDSLARTLDQYGIAAILALFVCASGYILWRLFGKNDGILTKVGEGHVEFLGRVAKSSERHSDTLRELTTTANSAHEMGRERVELLKVMLGRLGGDIDAIERIGEHAIDVVSAVCTRLEITEVTDASVASIKRELKVIRARERERERERPSTE